MRVDLVAEEREFDSGHAESRRALNSSLWLWTAIGAIVLGSAGHLFIKLGLTLGAHTGSAGLLNRAGNYLLQPWVIAGLAVYACGTALWIYAVSQRQISLLYPLTALTYVLVAVGGKLFFAEFISAGRWLGIGVVVVGVAMLQISENGVRQ
jgi:drug/metabolite transporter (DMT)-like permease